MKATARQRGQASTLRLVHPLRPWDAWSLHAVAVELAATAALDEATAAGQRGGLELPMAPLLPRVQLCLSTVRRGQKPAARQTSYLHAALRRRLSETAAVWVAVAPQHSLLYC